MAVDVTIGERSIRSAAIGTVVFALTIPASVIVLGPWLVSRWAVQPPFLGISLTRWLGVLIMVLGFPLPARAMARFVRQGRGTPAPWAAPERLVVTGPFLYVRNPMYIGVVSLIVGQALLLGSSGILVYAAVVVLCFHLFVVIYEEPHLRRVYGEQYEAYCRAVPRWLPRRRPAQI